MRLHTEVYGHRKRACNESRLWEKNPLQHRGIEPASAVRCSTNCATSPPRYIPIPSPWTLLGNVTGKRNTAISPSRGGDVAVYVFDIKQPSLPTPVYFVLVSISVLMALSTVFHSINSRDNSPLSHSVLPVSFLLVGPFNYVSLYESPLQP